MENELAKYDTMLIENLEGKKELEDNNIIVEQPDGRLKIKIPLPKNAISPHLIIELADGSYRKISAEVIGEYLVYESDFLGKVIVVGNGDVVSLPEEEQTPNSGGGIKPTVKGDYVSFSGANTGDTSLTSLYAIALITSFIIASYCAKEYIKKRD